jgi:hypothetical protein
MPVSAEPGFVKRYSTPASFRVWISNIPPVPVMVFRMVDLVVRVHFFAQRSRLGGRWLVVAVFAAS